MTKFQNKYRIPSARAQWWDYANKGAYFVTICTKNRVHYFGEIVECEPELIPTFIPSEIGTIVNSICLDLENQFAFSRLDEYVIMPNHLHLIIVITDNENVDMRINTNHDDDNVGNVETRLIASLQQQQTESIQTIPFNDDAFEINGGFAGNKNPMLHDNLSRIVRWLKGRCSFEIRKIHTDFEWQSRFHDHIIRNEIEYQNICNYIKNNPLNWKKDKFHTL